CRRRAFRRRCVLRQDRDGRRGAHAEALPPARPGPRLRHSQAQLPGATGARGPREDAGGGAACRSGETGQGGARNEIREGRKAGQGRSEGRQGREEHEGRAEKGGRKEQAGEEAGEDAEKGREVRGIVLGQKTHPIGFRLGVIRTWDSRWFAKKDYADWLMEDQQIRRYIRTRLKKAGIAHIEIERAPKKVSINIHAARPGMVIGRKGSEVDKLRDELHHLTEKKSVYLNIVEVKKPEKNAQLVAEHIALQLEQRVAFRRAMKKTISSAMRMGVKGIRVK